MGAIADVKQLVAGLVLWLVCQSLLFAAPLEVQGMRLWAAPDHTRVVFDSSGPMGYELSTLHNPERLVIDVPQASVGTALTRNHTTGGLVKGMRAAQFTKHVLRIVLDLQQPAKPRSFTLKPGGRYGHRLVIDLYTASPAQQNQAKAGVPAKPAATPAIKPRDESRVKKSLTSEELPARDLVIAIDAGHGGDDTGAIGRNGTYEKDVVLSIARRLNALIEKTPGMRPVLIRQGDYYIGLRQRMDKAREHKADLFISIHADSFRDQRVQGSSVFVLSNRGASSEMARWLAEKENASDLAGGVSLDDKDQLLAEVLLDLSQNATIEASITVAGNMLGELQRVGKTHKSTVQQAGFVVLKSPDIPSVLVETAFISNPTEERKLRDSRHQEALATAMLRGIKRYFANHPPPGTRLAARRYIIQQGDTLGVIAQQY
ncbi:MAG: N-acetylmuramoyl-L-alanine amidase, partial [Gammaproteobacteria bacterium]